MIPILITLILVTLAMSGYFHFKNSKTEFKNILVVSFIPVQNFIQDVSSQNNNSITVTGSSQNTNGPVVNGSSFDVSPQQKLRAEQLTSLFENGKIEIKYSYIENLDDGRGYTAGRAGFTTADGDLYQVVKLYTDSKPNNSLSKFLPKLKSLANEGSDSTLGLSGFKEAWIKSSQDSEFKKAQDKVVDTEYYQPAMKIAGGNDIKTALGKAIFYDSIIQHGGGNDPDSLSSMVRETITKAGGSPKTGVDEAKWLNTFIKVRRDTLLNATEESTRDVWKESVGRCDVFQQILNSGNLDLKGPIKIKTSEYDTTIP